MERMHLLLHFSSIPNFQHLPDWFQILVYSALRCKGGFCGIILIPNEALPLFQYHFLPSAKTVASPTADIAALLAQPSHSILASWALSHSSSFYENNKDWLFHQPDKKLCFVQKPNRTLKISSFKLIWANNQVSGQVRRPNSSLCKGPIVLHSAFSWSKPQLASTVALGVSECRMRFRAKEKQAQLLEGFMVLYWFSSRI